MGICLSPIAEKVRYLKFNDVDINAGIAEGSEKIAAIKSKHTQHAIGKDFVNCNSFIILKRLFERNERKTDTNEEKPSKMRENQIFLHK